MMRRRWWIVGIVLVTALVVLSKTGRRAPEPAVSPVVEVAAAVPEEPQAPAFDPRLRFRLDLIRSFLEHGDPDRAFTETAILRSSLVEGDPAAPVVESLFTLSLELRRTPEPEYWDFPFLVRMWSEIEKHPLAPPNLVSLSRRRLDALREERACSIRLASLHRIQAPLEAMRVAQEIRKRCGGTFVARRCSAKLEQVRSEYVETLRADARNAVAAPRAEAQGLSRLVALLEESVGFLGRWDPELRRLRDECAILSEDGRILQEGDVRSRRGDWEGAEQVFSRVRPDSPFAAAAREGRKAALLQVRFRQAYRKYLDGQAAAAIRVFPELLSEWPKTLANRDVLEIVATEVPRIVSRFEEAERKEKEDPRAARDGYRKILTSPVVEGWYLREARKRSKECDVRYREALEGRAREFGTALSAEDWPAALRLYRSIGSEDESGAITEKVRALVFPRAGEICRFIERSCWSGSFREPQRSAAALLESVLKRPDSVLARLERIKRDYPRHFSEKHP